MESSTSSALRGTADFHRDGTTVRRSVTIRRPRTEIEAALASASLPGSVSVTDAPGNRGTEVRVEAPATAQRTAKEMEGAYMNDDPGEQLSTLLRQFKAKLETGEVATVHGQPSGRVAKQS